MKHNNYKLKQCATLIKRRLIEMPTHELFLYFDKQLDFIKLHLEQDGKLSSENFDKLNIGVICAKELEHIDNEFCNVVYEMLEEIGPSIDWGFEV